MLFIIPGFLVVVSVVIVNAVVGAVLVVVSVVGANVVVNISNHT